MRGRLRRAALAWLIVLVASYSLAACHSLEVPLAGASMKSGDLEIVHMSAKDAAHFRAGMRAYLSALYSITDALTRNDPGTIEKSAREVGMTAVNGVSLVTVLELPPQFVLLATDTHQKFDALAAAADNRSTRNQILEHLTGIVANCTACHETYQIGSN